MNTTIMCQCLKKTGNSWELGEHMETGKTKLMVLQESYPTNQAIYTFLIKITIEFKNSPRMERTLAISDHMVTAEGN